MSAAADFSAPPIHRDHMADAAPVAVKEDNDYVAEVILHR